MWSWINSNVSWSGYNPPCLGYRSLKVIKVVWLKEGNALPVFALVNEHKFWHGNLQWAHFYHVRNDFSQQNKNRLKINRDRRRETPKATHPTIFWRRHWKKVPMTAWETSSFNGCTHMHAHTLAIHTERDSQITSRFGREKCHQKV